METIKKISLIIFLSHLLFSIDIKIDYNIKMFGIKTADLSVSYSDTILNNISAIKIYFNTTTSFLTSKIFFVDNQYTTIIDKKNFRLLYFKKESKQPNVINSIITYEDNDSLYYRNHPKSINRSYPNIFSLFYLLQYENIDYLKNNDFILEREGLLYNTNIHYTFDDDNYYYEIDFVNVKSIENTPINKYTDIFTWALFKNNAIRKVVIDKNSSNIIFCSFSIGLINIKAEIKRD